MNKNVITLYNIKRFTNQCFDKDNDKVASIIKGILDAKSPRISVGKFGKDKKLGFWMLTLWYQWSYCHIP
ncbi:TPA: hypothetical protein ENS27_03855 [bacterium]|nr:hypothetical protein [bacterium]